MAPPMTRFQTVGAGASVAAVLALSMPVIAAWEGLSLDPYNDIAGIATVCRGETHVQMRRYTLAECDAMFQRSVLKHASPILDCLPREAPTEVKAAFVSFGYNVGVNAACGSAAARKARLGNYPAACDALMNWVFVGKRRVQGLVNRRTSERALCRSGL
jgi:lysozyme